MELEVCFSSYKKIKLNFKVDVLCETSLNGWILWLYSAAFLLFYLYLGDTFSKSAKWEKGCLLRAN